MAMGSRFIRPAAAYRGTYPLEAKIADSFTTL
jgi:hypothetical protein